MAECDAIGGALSDDAVKDIQGTGKQPVIAVNAKNVTTSSHRDTCSPCGEQAFIALANQIDKGLFASPSLEDR